VKPGPYFLGGIDWALDVPLDTLPEDALTFIPGLRTDQAQSRVVGDIGAVAVACKRLGVTPPLRECAPLRSLEDKPLREYQKYGVSWLRQALLHESGVLLADDMGVGKSRQTIALANSLNSRLLVVSPASARETWLEEAVKWGWREDEVALVLPVNDRRCAAEAEKVPTARMVVTSYELLKRAGNGYPLIAFEEMHALKGRKNKLLGTIQERITMAQFRLGITATPDYDRPRDWYALLKILLGRRFGSAMDFDIAYCGGHFDEANHWQNTGATQIDELKLRLSYYLLRREKREVLKELPPKSRQVIWLPADARATEARRSMSRTADGFHKALLAALDAKKEVCVKMAAEARRFLLFTWLKEDARQLQARCIAEGAKCVRIDGNMTHHQRQAAIKIAQNERIGIVATLDSAGQSLNLQGVASYGIMHALSPSPNKMLQAEDRIYRFGTTEAVQWMYPAVRDSADELVIRHNVNKLDMMRGNKPGTSEQTAMRDDLNAGPAGVPTEDEVLAAAYAEME
jgi:SNF2 family DNA or RNA helicase